jgi:hypothetical protein
MRPGCQFAICDMLATTDDKGTQGSLLRTGLQSEFVNVYIIVDAIKTGDYSIGAIADHIAMLALSRTEAFDACQPLPSIANLTAPNCDRKTSAITQTDLAYLKGIYSMDAGANLVIQQSTISAKIEAAITGQQ